jgi:hypothetical protein
VQVQFDPQLQFTHLQLGLLHFTVSVTVDKACIGVVVVAVDFIIFFLVVIDRTKVLCESRTVSTILWE